MPTRILFLLMAVFVVAQTSPTWAQTADTGELGTAVDVSAHQTQDPLDIPQGGSLPSAPQHPVGVLAEGNPSLTQATSDRFAGFVMWLLDAPLTQSQRQDLQDAFVDSWRNQDPAGMSTVLTMADAYSQLAGLSETQRIQLRNQLQPQVLDHAKMKGDDFSRWMLDIYNAAHQPIAEGNPPLTREMSDANAEVTYFVLQVVASGDGAIDGVHLEPSDFDVWAQGLSSKYASFTPDQQQMMANMPLFRATMTEGWRQLSDEQRGHYREVWRPYAEQWLASVPDDTFVALFKASLVEDTPSNRDRYSAIVARDAGQAPSAIQPDTRASQAAYEQAMAQLQARHSTFMMLSGGMMSSWVGNMNAINNLGDSPYTYVMK